ncbi:MAG: class I adenylate-forming enzyme family protein [Congregibacter sp.]
MNSLPSLIERAARLNPQGLGTSFEGRHHSYAQLQDRIARLATGLQTFGLNQGDRVAILSLNSDRYYESIFSIGWAGYCMVPLNTRWALPENEYAIGDAGARAILFDDGFSSQVKLLLESLPGLECAVYMGDGDCPAWASSYEQLIDANPPAARFESAADDMVGIFYTGGTTGFPKGVMLSHKAMWASAVSSIPDFGITREGIYLHVAPMFHVADFAGGMGALLRAGGHVILPGFDPAQVLETLASESITHVLLVPSMIKAVMNHPNAASTDVSTLERVFYGASPMPIATLRLFMDTWPDVGLVQAYGQTELAPVITTLSEAAHRKGGDILKSAGQPTPVVDVRVVNEQGEDLPQGTQGEVIVSGPNTMIGYWNKPEETANALRDGWVYTGDAGFFDAAGFLYIVDRVKDMVITGGENVFTTEVENAVISHDAVLDVAVIGIPHAEWGEAVHAIVVLHPDQHVSEEALIAHCRTQIAGYKLPKSVSFRDQPLPLSGAGKVLKTELRKPFWEGQERQVG